MATAVIKVIPMLAEDGKFKNDEKSLTQDFGKSMEKETAKGICNGGKKGVKNLTKDKDFTKGMQAIGGLIVGQLATQAVQSMESAGIITGRQSRFAGSMLGLAATGAGIGSLFMPGIGTVIGGAAGALAGFTFELLNSRSAMAKAFDSLRSMLDQRKDMYEVGESFGISGADYINTALAFEHSGMKPRQLEQMIGQYIGVVGGRTGQNDVYTFLSEMQTLFNQFSAEGGGGRAGFQEFLQKNYQLSPRGGGRLYQAIQAGAMDLVDDNLGGTPAEQRNFYAITEAQERAQMYVNQETVKFIANMDALETETFLVDDGMRKLRDTMSELKDLSPALFPPPPIPKTGEIPTIDSPINNPLYPVRALESGNLYQMIDGIRVDISSGNVNTIAKSSAQIK